MGKQQVTRLCVLAGMLVLIGGNAVAAAATTSPFGCRASVSRAVVGNTTLAEPVVANPATNPCHTAGNGANNASVLNQGSAVANAGGSGAFTYSSADAASDLGATAPAAAALASVNNASIPTSSGAITADGPVTVQVQYVCQHGVLTSSGSSNVQRLDINGQQTDLNPGQSKVIDLGGGSYVDVNEQIKTGNSLTERALDAHLAGVGEIVSGEADVTEDAATPCAGTASLPSSPVGACPTGATYDAATQYCVIIENGRTITVSRPFQGPTGGSVISLTDARKKYRSQCLSGSGPNYAVVGTSRGDRIVGTRLAERILGLGGNDRIAGQGGNDCLDGGVGNDRIYAGNGNVRVYGGAGGDRVYANNGNDYIDGGAGNDRIYIGDGNDRVYGGDGNDVISAGRGNNRLSGGNGNDHISTSDGNDIVDGGPGANNIHVGNGTDKVTTGRGNDRIFAPGENDSVACGAGKDLAYVNPFVVTYAKHRGCERVRAVRPHRSV
jgi:Ca2+-binding RTX toxin-like protein